MTDLAAFLTAKDAAGLSPATLLWYEKRIRQFLEWSQEANRPFVGDELEAIKKPETVEAFLASLRERDISAFTISGVYRALHVYYRWLVQRRKLDASPLDQVQPPRVPRQRKKHVTHAQFTRLYRGITGTNWLDARDRAALLILFYSGLRANELLGLRVEDVDVEQGILRVVQGKGGRDRDVPFADAVAVQVRNYLNERPDYRGRKLFVASGPRVTDVSGPLTYWGLTQMVRRRCEACGLPRLGLHAFRHGYAMLFLNEGAMELPAVAATLGHSSVEVTRRFYADFTTNTLVDRYQDALAKIEGR